MTIKNILYSLIGLMLPLSSYADHCGAKVDAGAVYVHIDVLESGHTIKKLDMAGFKLNGTVMLKEGTGFCVKPDILYASGHGELISGAFGFGHVTPINDQFCITPSAGITVTNLRTSVNAPIFEGSPLIHFRQRFRSHAPYIALDFNYNMCKGFRICANIQYSWSRTHTRVHNSTLDIVQKFKGNSKGPSYALMVEKDINDHWSMHLGAAYNSSLSHEKHGLRGYGIKLGAARWF